MNRLWIFETCSERAYHADEQISNQYRYDQLLIQLSLCDQQHVSSCLSLFHLKNVHLLEVNEFPTLGKNSPK